MDWENRTGPVCLVRNRLEKAARSSKNKQETRMRDKTLSIIGVYFSENILKKLQTFLQGLHCLHYLYMDNAGIFHFTP
ncbi:hypothetical protein ADH76_11890 [Enterocloster clostridioformis]|nr:hypothetical protein A4V08_22720 [Lachnoclostridium sp. YL32]OXE69096.1 hypothetical protein ADH76_11890 [Enterocloster clostridioformis]